MLAINQTQQLWLLLSYKKPLKGGAQAAPEDVGKRWPGNSCALTSASPAAAAALQVLMKLKESIFI